MSSDVMKASAQADAQEQAGGARSANDLASSTRLAVEIRGLIERGAMDEARDRFCALVIGFQRRACRLAYQYLRDTAEADDAVQDAFVKVFTRLTSYREQWPFEVWFKRILINGCLDRRKMRARQDRWFPRGLPDAQEQLAAVPAGSNDSDHNPEARLIARERRARMAGAIGRLEGRQRMVFMLCHYGDCSTREVSQITGLTESTVRVHLFRAAHKLRALLGGRP